MSLESAKTLSGIGSFLIALGCLIPFLGVVGIIILLIGLKELSDYYGERRIFENALYGFVFGLVGILAAGFTFFSTFMLRFMEVATTRAFISFTLSFLLSLLVLFIFHVLGAVFYKRAFTLIADKSNEKLFNTAGVLLIIGAILTIVVVGLIVMFIAWIVATAAFFSVKPKAMSS